MIMENVMRKILIFCVLLLCLSACAAPAEEPANSTEAAPAASTESLVSQQDGIVIALLDTGVSASAIQSDSLLPGWNYVTDSADTEDRINHGTAVTSVILGCESAGVKGLAPEALVVPLVVTDKMEAIESVSPETLAQAIRDSVDTYGADIINISLGIKKDVPEVREAVEYAEQEGALVVAAVGNEGKSEELYYPAAYGVVLAVGSHDKYGEVSDFSQKNGTVDLLAPGEDIWLASRNGKTYGTRGTSYATGFVSAAAANLWGTDAALTPAEVRELLFSSAIDIESPGCDADSGWGMLNLEAGLLAEE